MLLFNVKGGMNMNNMMNQMNSMNNMNMKNEGGDMNNPFAMMMNQMQVIYKLYLQGAVSGDLMKPCLMLIHQPTQLIQHTSFSGVLTTFET